MSPEMLKELMAIYAYYYKNFFSNAVNEPITKYGGDKVFFNVDEFIKKKMLERYKGISEQ